MYPVSLSFNGFMKTAPRIIPDTKQANQRKTYLYSLIYVAYDTKYNPWENISELVMKIHATSNLRGRYIRTAEYNFGLL